MDYLKKKFSVAAAPTEEYRDNWERIFGKDTLPHATGSKYTMDGVDVEIEGACRVHCLCGGEVDVGTAAFAAGDLEVLVHSVPHCKEFEVMEPVDFIRWLRTEREKRGTITEN